MARRGRRPGTRNRVYRAEWNPKPLRDWLERNGVTQAEFAELGPFALRSVGYWLSGEKSPEGEAVFEIACITSIPMEQHYNVTVED